MKVFGFVFSIFSLIGCSSLTLSRTMAGKIGCQPEEIEVLESNPGLGIVHSTWTAQCNNNQKFVCSLRPGARSVDDMDSMSCRRISRSNRRAVLSSESRNVRGQNFEAFVEGLNKKIDASAERVSQRR